MEHVEIINCSGVLVSTPRGRFDNVTLRFCGLLLGFVDDCTITGCYVSPPLIGSYVLVREQKLSNKILEPKFKKKMPYNKYDLLPACILLELREAESS